MGPRVPVSETPWGDRHWFVVRTKAKKEDYAVQ
jgi:hypothetical protein